MNGQQTHSALEEWKGPNCTNLCTHCTETQMVNVDVSVPVQSIRDLWGE